MVISGWTIDSRMYSKGSGGSSDRTLTQSIGIGSLPSVMSAMCSMTFFPDAALRGLDRRTGAMARRVYLRALRALVVKQHRVNGSVQARGRPPVVS
jgi:hypothetical protein